MIYIASLVLLFILRIRFPTNQPIVHIIRRRHGVHAVKCFRNLEKIINRTSKLIRDVKYLETCLSYEVIPKFLRIKLYRRTLEKSPRCTAWQTELLRKEIQLKEKELNSKEIERNRVKSEFTNIVGKIDSACINLWLSNKQRTIDRNTDSVHNSKLHRLGISPLSQKLDVRKVIFNHSNYTLSQEEQRVLMLGLDFGLPITSLKYFKYFLCFEKLVQILQNYSIYDFVDNAKTQFLSQMKSIANRYYYGFKFCKYSSPLFSKKDFNILKNLGKQDQLYISKPDKGNGVVIMNKTDYISKINRILNDNTKFNIAQTDEKKLILKLEDKLNNVLRQFKNCGGIIEELCKSCYASGTRLGNLYGLPKVHKIGLPLRPILSACGTHNFNLSQALVPLISFLTNNDYILKNSQDFTNFITNVPNANSLYMCSFDIESLYTNIPVLETIDIILNRVFSRGALYFNGFSRKQFRSILELCFKNSYFKFNNNIYHQLDGLCMGGPISPVAANIFLNDFECKILDDCPPQFKPQFYKRYLDDTFLLFNSEQQAKDFFNFINGRHPNISFTFEGEQNNSLSFLDVTVLRQGNTFNTSIFRKATFTGLGLNFFSNIFYQYKLSTIKTLINRAFILTSSYQNFHCEIEYLRSYFVNNMFPSKLFNSALRIFLQRKFENTAISIITVPKQDIYLCIPYIGKQSIALKKEISTIISKFYPQTRPKLYFKNSFKIGSFFKKSVTLPVSLRSSVVYQYTCDCCEQSYIGSTKLQMFYRCSQHCGVSHRTGRHITKPMHSSIRIHSENHDHPLKLAHFSILDS